MHGGVVQGLGWALLERMPYDVTDAPGARFTGRPITGEAIRGARWSGPLP